jgi:signal transduction histidine kinase/ActR/RegA family two-component response regulator
MGEISAKIQLMRDEQLKRSMRAVAILGFFTLLSSLSRIFWVGWHNLLYFHIALYLLVLSSLLLERHLSFFLRAAVPMWASFLLGTAGLIYWGIGAFSLPAFFCFCILSTMFFGARAGILACVLSIVTIGIVGVGVCTGILTFNFSAAIQLNSPITWITGLFVMTLLIGIAVVALGTLNQQMEGLVRTLESQNEELLHKNVLLENEIEERARSEEERRQLESKLQLAKKMESIGKLAGGVAHDLNNTLGSIVGYPDLLLDDLPQQSPLREVVHIIQKSGIKAAAIVNDMLTLARSGIISRETVDLNSVISEYCDSPEFSQLISFHRGVVVDVRLEKEALSVRGSFFHLSKVVMNLVSNAAEAIPGGGRITISTERHHISDPAGLSEEIKKGEYAVLCVSDTGIGIPPEDLERIFEPFYTKKTMGRSGTGLGMAVVWGSVKDHNGHIAVESTEGKGTKFTVYIPLTKEPLAGRKSLCQPKAPPGKGESILVIDDVKEQREIASKILEKIGYAVHAVASGEEALAYLRQSSADLLILDMLMEPGMDGLETYRKILEIRPGQKALIASGFTETWRVKEAERLGVGGYLKKPYLLNQIGLAVRAELDRPLHGGSRFAPGAWN